MFAKLYRKHLGFAPILLAMLFISTSLPAQNQPRAAPDMELPLVAEQTAEAIGVRPLYEQLRGLAAQPDTTDRFELLYLQQQALLQITSASLEVDASAEEVDFELAEVRGVEN